jgi:hypothetical protein
MLCRGDMTDLSTWKGAFNLKRLGDANGDGHYEAVDYTLYFLAQSIRAAPGAGAGNGAEVPEPPTVLPAIIAGWIAWFFCPGRRPICLPCWRVVSGCSGRRDGDYTQSMSSNVDAIDPSLRRRHLIVCCLFLVVVIANLYMSIRGDRLRNAHAESLAAKNAEVEAQMAETRATLDEAEKLRQQADDLREQAAKIAKGGKHATPGGSSTAPAKQGS